MVVMSLLILHPNPMILTTVSLNLEGRIGEIGGSKVQALSNVSKVVTIGRSMLATHVSRRTIPLRKKLITGVTACFIQSAAVC